MKPICIYTRLLKVIQITVSSIFFKWAQLVISPLIYFSRSDIHRKHLYDLMRWITSLADEIIQFSFTVKAKYKNRFLCAALAFPWLKEMILRSPFLSSLFKIAIIQYLCLLHLCPAGLKWHTLECSYHENKVNNGSWITNSKRSWYDSVKCQVFTTEAYEKPCYLSVIYSYSIDWWSFKFFCSFPIKVLKFSMKCQISYCMPFRET